MSDNTHTAERPETGAVLLDAYREMGEHPPDSPGTLAEAAIAAILRYVHKHAGADAAIATAERAATHVVAEHHAWE